MLDDVELLRRFADSGDQAAFTELVRRRIDFVYAAAYRQTAGDSASAADVAQNVFHLLARKAPQLTGRPMLHGWLYATTRLMAKAAMRTERRRHIHEYEASVMTSITSDSPSPPDWSRLAPFLDEAMSELPEKDRDALLLRYFENLPLGKVGAKCGLTENAARMRVDRALDKLRGRLEQRGITSTAAAVGSLLLQQTVNAAPAQLAGQVAAGVLAGLVPTTAGGALGWGFMHIATKQKAAGLAVLALIELGVFLDLESRAEARIAAAKEEDDRKIVELRADLRDLQRPVAGAEIPAAVTPREPPQDEALLSLRTLSEIINQGGLGGRIAWNSDSLATTVSRFAEVLGLSSTKTDALQAAVEKARAEILALALKAATIQRTGDSLAINVLETPETRERYNEMLGSIAGIVGDDRYPLLAELGFASSIEDMLRPYGLGGFLRYIDSVRDGRDGSVSYSFTTMTPVMRASDVPGKSRTAGMTFSRKAPTGSTREEIKASLGPMSVLLPDDF